MKNILLICCLLFFTKLHSQQNSVKTLTANENNVEQALTWHDDLKKAIPLSINNNKPLLLFFTGSDWCGWCIRLQREVFKFEEFKKWANDNVILVELDYPRRKQLAPNITKQNREIQQIFGVRGYPTVWLVTPQIIKSNDPENPADRINFLKLGTLGYVAGGPEKWINTASSFLVNK
tara:strand:+ start:262 stop:792 length:531 start_codon:yes stop_codon:yes gene_type:complete